MELESTFLRYAAAQQDFLWFASLLVWSLTAVVWWHHPERRRHWAWIPDSAGFAILSAAVQFLLFSQPFDFFHDRLVPGTTLNYSPALLPSGLFAQLTSLLLAAGAGIAWWLLPDLRKQPWALPGLAVAALLLLLQPAAAPPVFAALRLLALPFLSRASTRPKDSHGLVLVLCSLLPLWELLGPSFAPNGPGRLLAPSPLNGLICATAQLLTGGLAFARLAPGVIGTFGAFRRDAGKRLLLAAGWLAAGLVFAYLNGRDNRHEVLQNRLRAAAALVATFDAGPPAALLAGDFRLPPDSDGTALPGFTRETGRKLAQALRQTADKVPFVEDARFVSLYDGWLFAFAARRAPPAGVSVRLLRRATTRDREHWAKHEHYFEASPAPAIGDRYYCRAAVLARDGRMIGWLELVRSEYFLSLERNWRVAPLLVTALGLIIAFFATAIERKIARDRESALREAAIATEANRVKSLLLANVSHELRTPLQSILGYGELLAKPMPAEESARHLAALRQHGELMLRLVNDLLDLSALQSGAFRFIERPVRLPELIRQTVASEEPRAHAKGLALTCEIGPEVPTWIEADAARLRQIMLNLLGNAVKFTAQGHIDVRVSSLPTTSDRTTIFVAVHDTGPGITAAQQARLFLPFSRLESAAADGTGLGLALVAGLCRAQGGDVSLESDGHSGSCFRAQLPVRIIAAPTTRPEVRTNEISLAGRHLLIADDNRLIRELFVADVTARGATCETADDGEQALTLAKSGRHFDALVLDLGMPKLDGLEVARRLRTWAAPDRPCPKLIGVSAHASPADRTRSLAAGMDEFLAKPVELRALAAALAAPGATATQSHGERALRDRFLAETPDRAGELRHALDRRDWAAVQRGAHYLANSALAVKNQALMDSCRNLEDAAAEGTVERAEAAWRECASALALCGVRTDGV